MIVNEVRKCSQEGFIDANDVLGFCDMIDGMSHCRNCGNSTSEGSRLVRDDGCHLHSIMICKIKRSAFNELRGRSFALCISMAL